MIIHPFLISLYPIATLLASNIHEIDLTSAARSAVYSILLTIVLFIGFKLLLRDWHRAAIMTSITLILFFSYGHVYNVIRGFTINQFILGRHRFLISLWLGFFLISLYFFRYRARKPQRLTSIFNAVAVFTIIFPIAQIAIHEVQSSTEVIITQPLSSKSIEAIESNKVTTPDIYYIILDAYAREDVLSEHYGFDNSDFSNTLRKMGFYIADSSNTNYMYSALSIGSALNMQYVQDFNVDFNRVTYPEFMIEPTRHSIVREKLEEHGYVLVNLPSGYPPTTFEDADYFITPEMKMFEVLQESRVLNQFEGLLINTSAIRVLVDLQTSKDANWFAEQLEYPYHLHRIRILSAFRNLETIPLIDGPKFVFAHIVIPHRPYTFGSNGEWLEPNGVFSFKELYDLPTSEREAAYLAQLTYASFMIEKTLNAILEKSEDPPIIILQSDHGPDFGLNWHDPVKTPLQLTYRAGILNAYYLPENCRDHLYPSISPVNSFRVIFNCVFNESYEILEDIPYFNNIRYSALSEPWFFIPIDEIEEDTFPVGN